MKQIKHLWLAAAVITALSVVACGGGGSSGGGGGGAGGSAAAPAAVPDSASASVAAFIAFITGLDQNDETSEPLTIGDNFVAPTDDSTDTS